MRLLTEDEQTAVFSKLANYIVSYLLAWTRSSSTQTLTSCSYDSTNLVGQEYRTPGRPTRRSVLFPTTPRSGVLCLRIFDATCNLGCETEFDKSGYMFWKV